MFCCFFFKKKKFAYRKLLADQPTITERARVAMNILGQLAWSRPRVGIELGGQLPPDQPVRDVEHDILFNGHLSDGQLRGAILGPNLCGGRRGVHAMDNISWDRRRHCAVRSSNAEDALNSGKTEDLDLSLLPWSH